MIVVVFNKKYLKTKTKSYDGKITTNFNNNNNIDNYNNNIIKIMIRCLMKDPSIFACLQ